MGNTARGVIITLLLLGAVVLVSFKLKPKDDTTAPTLVTTTTTTFVDVTTSPLSNEAHCSYLEGELLKDVTRFGVQSHAAQVDRKLLDSGNC